MNTPDTEWSDLIINLGVEVDTHQDGDAFVRTFTFNDAQLEAFISSRDTYWKERVRKEVEGMKVWFMEEDYRDTFPLISKEEVLDNLK